MVILFVKGISSLDTTTDFVLVLTMLIMAVPFVALWFLAGGYDDRLDDE